MVPAQEGLDRTDPPGMGKFDRLVHEVQFAAREGTLQLGRQLHPLARGGAHLLAVQLAAPAAALLRLVHRRVGGVKEGDRGVGGGTAGEQVVGGERNADARASLDLDPLQHDLPGDGGAHALRDVECHVLVEDALAQHHELVPRDACDGVARPGGRRETPRDGHDQLVAHGVADGVVHVLQLVEVDEENRDVRAGRSRTLEGLGGLAQEQHPVRKSGERVVGGQAVEFGAGLALLGDVPRDRGPVVHRSVALAHDLDDDGEGARQAVGRTEGDLTLPAVRGRCAGLQHEPGELVAHRLHVRARRDVVGHGARGVDAEQGTGGVVRERERPDPVEHDHRVAGHVQQADQLVRQGRLFDHGRDVDGRADPADDAAAVQPRRGVDAHPHGRAVGRRHGELARERRGVAGVGEPRTFALRAHVRHRVRPRRRALHHGATPEGEKPERVVRREQPEVRVGLEHPNGQGGSHGVYPAIVTERIPSVVERTARVVGVHSP